MGTLPDDKKGWKYRQKLLKQKEQYRSAYKM